MKYADGEVVHVGDVLRLWFNETGEEHGEVVCSMDTNEYTADYPESEWAYLAKGILVTTPSAGLIHYLEFEKQMTLVRRGSGK